MSDPLANLPEAPTGKVGKTSQAMRKSSRKLKTLEQRLADLKKTPLTPSQKGQCTRMGTTLAALINESNALGKRAQAIEKKIDELAAKIARDGDVCELSKKKKK